MAVDGVVLVTGVNGFMGTRLAERLLADGTSVRGMDVQSREGGPRVEFVRGDVTRSETLDGALAGCRLVFHCVRWTGRPWTWEAARAVEVDGVRNLFQACLRARVSRVICLSSLAVYGPTHESLITEETALWPVGVYGATKVEAERVGVRAVESGLDVVTLRSGQVYGPGAPGGTLSVVRRLLAGWPVLVDGGRGMHHPVFVSNLIDAMIAAATRESIGGETFNVADGDLSWREFCGHYARMTRRPLRSAPAAAFWLWGAAAELAGRMSGRPPRLQRADLGYLTRSTRCSTGKVRARLGWSPARAVPEAMEETERWLRAKGLIGT